MKNSDHRVWLTTAVNDEVVPSVLTLCFSLRKVMTSYKLAVIVSPSVSRGLKAALNHSFDYVFLLDPDLNTEGLEDEEFAKIFALSLKGFERVVMLAPSMMVVKNSDELMELEKDENGGQSLIWVENGDTSVMILHPSFPVFREVMKGIPNRNGGGVNAFLKMWTTNQTPNCSFINQKYCQRLDYQRGMIEEEKNIFIVNLDNKLKLMVNRDDDVGIVGERILKLWKSIHGENVLPLLEAVTDLTQPFPEEPQSASSNEAIVIVGMGCRFPGANNLEEFWQILLNGEDATGNPPEFRWRREQCSRNKADSRKANAGFLKCPVDDFDAKFFNISPKEMVFLDPQHRLLHEIVWEALEDAAVDPISLEGTNGGVFIGSWLNDYKDILNHTGNDEFYRMYMGNSIGAGAARISHLLGMTGPSIATESGCSSAMVAVHLACKSLRRRETNFALACGVNLLLHPFDGDEMPMVVSPDGHCKTFDANANGFARGEGCGVLVLKRVSDAVRDGDKIWALIRGTGMTQEGVSKSMGTPTVHCESMAMKQALRDAGVAPEMVSYVEAHGTGTPVGDPMEIAAIAKAYHSSQRKEPLLIGSVKTNVGHTESCSGITGIMKVVLAMQNEIIPAHRNFETLNPAIDLDAVPAKIPLEPVKWPKQNGIPRLAGVSSFGITGTDAHAIIEEAPSHAPALTMNNFERPLHIMKVSAKTAEAMDILLDSYKNQLSTSDDDLKDLAFTANIGRAEFGQRAIIIAKSKEDAIRSIEKNKILRGEESPETIGKVCFLFTGQGSQYPGMAKNLYETSPVFRMHFEYCQKILKNNYNIDITQVLWSDDKSAEVSRTIYSQTSIFCVEYALLKLWESWGVKADFALGHSLGEFAAAVCTGMLTVEDAIKLVAERSRLIDNLPRGTMLVMKADKQQVDTLMKKFAGNDKNKILDYAAVNAPDQTVVAGDSEAVLQFSECCKKSNLKNIVLDATHAFHSKHMDPMLAAYGEVAKTVQKLPGNDCKYISGMKGTVLETNQVNPQYWVLHTREKVLFMDASKKAVELGCKTFIEIGPQPVLSALTMMNNDTQLLCLPSLKRNEKEWETLLNTLGKLHLKGLAIDWKSFDQFYNRKKVSLPHYPFIGKKYWTEIISLTGSSIHPLIGSVIPNASSTKIFQNGLNISSIEWVKDHAIGDNVIFPGAGFLEMCLAAGLATVEGSTETLTSPTRAMKVENLSIQAPLSLDESKTAQVQTVVDLNMSSKNDGDWNDMKISISRKMESDSTKWLPHAKATFSPLPTAEEKAVSFDIDAFTETLNKSSDDNFIQEIYDKLASVGLKFGPTFRSLEKVWRDEVKQTLLAKVKVPSGETSGQSTYIIHPVVLDAMIQAIMMLRITSNLKKTLYVPIKIGKFIWLSAPNKDPTDLYIHAFEAASDSSSDSALLIDSTGEILAVMSSVEFIDTTVKAINSVLEQQTSSMPDLWEEVWKPQLGPFQERVDVNKTKATCDELNIIPDDCNTPASHIAEIFGRIEKLVYLNFLRCLYECRWKPILGVSFKEQALSSQLGIHSSFHKYFGFMLEVLQMENILEKEPQPPSNKEVRWRVAKIPPSLEETMEHLNSPTFTSSLCSEYRGALLLIKVGETLHKIITGSEPALSILFPQENQEYPSVADFYTAYDQFFRLHDAAVPKLIKRTEHMKTQMGGQRFVWRCLEIGAGTGSYSDVFLRVLEESGIEFEYTYTDVSAAFFPTAEKRFEKYGKRIIFKKLNIEEDPIDQGFSPEYYDLVCASDVIHTTKNIKDALQNMRLLMKPGAKLDIQEMTRVHRFVTYLFGLLEGFWRFEDLELRPRHCTLSTESWANVLSSTGFEVDGIFPVLNSYHSIVWATKTSQTLMMIKPKNPKSWLLFQPKTECQLATFLKKRVEGLTSRNIIVVEPGTKYEGRENYFKIRETEEQDYKALFESLEKLNVSLEGIIYCWSLDHKISSSQEKILQPYFYLTKSLLTARLRVTPRLVGVTNGVIPVEDTDLSSFPASSLWGYTKSMKNENNGMGLKFVDVKSGPLSERQLEEVFFELWDGNKEVLIAYRGGTRFYPKFQPHKLTTKDLKLPPGSDRFQLVLPESNSISDLMFGHLDAEVLKEDEVEVQVKASALNFRDVLSVIKPTEQFKNINAVGFDLAGVVKRVGERVTKWKVGDRVSGCNMDNSALPSHVKLNQDLLIHVPEHMTLCEAATLPAVYVTSVVCLIETAKIKKGDVVLLHTATGGVGLSAIEICKHVGCTIIATAGSKRKQNYLRSLGIQHIFHSRNTKYGDDILELTNGKGVDVVLNSLTSEGFKEATLKACGKGARFIEMSKLNIWTNEEVQALRPDVNYTIVDVSSADASEWNRYMGVLRDLTEKQVVKPIPYVRFDALNIREALQYMQKAKHIGKIVCTMPELRNEGGEVKTFTPMFNENSAYLITGGLGGIGFVVCQWMLDKGAKHVIVAGRSSPTPSIQAKINELNLNGANVKAVKLDVSNFEQCKQLIQTQICEMELPPLKGVMHAAGTISDGLIINQDWSKLSSTFSTKINGTLNLHELTKDLNLEHFVVFSSMAALFGPPGQCNHAAGNNFEDALIHYRNSIGLPGTTVNWGQWGEVGIATEIDLPGLKTISNLQGTAGLEYALKSHRTQLSVVNVESFLMMSKLFPHLAVYLDERVWKSSNATVSVAIKSDEFWQKYDSQSNEPKEKITLLKVQLKNILKTVLKLDENEPINEDGNFQEMGVDSLMFVEIKNHLQALLGNRVVVNASALKDCNTINLLAETLVKMIEGEGNEIENEAPPSMEQVKELIREDCILPEQIRAKPGQNVGYVGDIKVVLLAGCTGTFGPYILKELTNSPQITQVVCLMRPSRKENVEERLKKILASRGLISQVNMSKILCVAGNVAQTHLGMDSESWETLSSSVDAIFNCSARVQHYEQYIKRQSENDVRAVNILGMKNLLEFACETKLKHFCQASSLLAVKTTDEDGKISESWPNIEDFDGVTTLAYPISKFVSDFLCKEAVERGIPCKVLRLPFISGESETGRCVPENNHVLLRYMFILKNKIMANIPIPIIMLPIDTCSNLSIRLFLDERAEPNIYNIGNANPDLDQAFVQVAEKLGHKVEIVEFSEFTQRVQESSSKDAQSALTLFSELYKDSDALMSIYSSATVIQRWIEGAQVFENRRVQSLIPNFYEDQRPAMDYVYNDLQFLKSQGWFEKFGL